jgi:hypothetical protein
VIIWQCRQLSVLNASYNIHSTRHSLSNHGQQCKIACCDIQLPSVSPNSITTIVVTTNLNFPAHFILQCPRSSTSPWQKHPIVMLHTCAAQHCYLIKAEVFSKEEASLYAALKCCSWLDAVSSLGALKGTRATWHQPHARTIASNKGLLLRRAPI